MVRKLKAQEEGRFADIVTIHQEAFALLDHEGMNVTDGRAAGRFVNHVAKVTR